MKNRRIAVAAASGLLALGIVIGWRVRASHADGVPLAVPLVYGGYLENAGAPVDGPTNLIINVWQSAMSTSSTDQVCTTNAMGTSVSHGYFRVNLDPSCTTAVSHTPNLWVEVLVAGTSLGRTPIAAVPFAIEANHAPNADNATTATSATMATMATTAMNAMNATGALATTISTIQTNATALSGEVSANMVQAGSVGVTLGAGGMATVNFPTPFPTAARSVVVTAAEAYSIPMSVVASSASSFTFVAWYGYGGASVGTAEGAGTYIAVNWVAVGH